MMTYPRVFGPPSMHLSAGGAPDWNRHRREAVKYDPLRFQPRRYRLEGEGTPDQDIAHVRLHRISETRQPRRTSIAADAKEVCWLIPGKSDTKSPAIL
jgi:hypothetical protein